MSSKITDKYGQRKKIRYLVSSLDDVRDIVVTVSDMLSRRCERDDVETVAALMDISAIPLKNKISSFILSIDIPSFILEPKKMNYR